MNPLRMLRIYRAANRTLDALDEGAKDVRLYRQRAYWERVLLALRDLVLLIPMPERWRGEAMNDTFLKIGVIAGVVVGIAGQLQALPLSPKVAAVVGSVATIAGAIAGIFHPQPRPAPKS